MLLMSKASKLKIHVLETIYHTIGRLETIYHTIGIVSQRDYGIISYIYCSDNELDSQLIH